MTYCIEHGDCLEVMRGMGAESVDAVVTDPPYGLKFMGKDWDHGLPGVHFWEAAYALLKPSSYLLAFGGTRTWHRLACALEDAGFEIRDTLMWLYGSGFPKGRACLKPAWEPVILARKPGPMRELGVEECRIGTEPVVSTKGLGDNWRMNDDGWKGIGNKPEPTVSSGRWPANLVLDEEAAGMVDEQSGLVHGGWPIARAGLGYGGNGAGQDGMVRRDEIGGASRFYFIAKGDPCDANTAGMSSCPLSGLDASALNDAATLAAREATRPPRGSQATPAFTTSCAVCTQTPNPALCAALLANIGITTTTASLSKSCGSVALATDAPTNSASAGRVAVDSDQESVTRFLYSPKASRRERNAGLEGMEAVRANPYGEGREGVGKTGHYRDRQNHHPTVKPVALMRWLVRLVAREGDLVLDPFLGSGTTGIAAVTQGRNFVGIEKEAEYIEIARRRLAVVAAQERLPV